MTEFLNLVYELVGSLEEKSEDEKDKVKEVLVSDLSIHLESLQRRLSEQLEVKQNFLELLSEIFSAKKDKQLALYKSKIKDRCKEHVDTIKKLVAVHTDYKLKFKEALESDCKKEKTEYFKFDFNIKSVEYNVEINKFVIEFCHEIDDHFRHLEKVFKKEKDRYDEEIETQSKFWKNKIDSIKTNNRELINKNKKYISDKVMLMEFSEKVTKHTNEELEKERVCTTGYFKFAFPLKEKVKSIREKAETSIEKTKEENLQSLKESFDKEINKRDQLKAEAEDKYKSTHKSLKRDYNSDLSSYIESLKYNYFYRVIRHIDFLDVIGITKAIENNEKSIKERAETLTADCLREYEKGTNDDTFGSNAKFEFGLAEALKEDNKKCKEQVEKTLKHDCDDSKYSELETFKKQQKSCTIQ